MQYYRLKELLDNLYTGYQYKFSSKDPVWNLHRFSEEKDIELIAFITAVYCYGSVELINGFIEKFLKKISFKPHEFIINFSKHKDKKYLNSLSYRFYTDDDLVRLVIALRKSILIHGSLKNLFNSYFKLSQKNIIEALERFSATLNSCSKGNSGKNFHYMVSNPANGSTCKRMNLFLRWMVRKDEIDLGLWRDIPASKLIMPVDTHVARVSKKLGLVKRKSVDLKFAVELTEHLKKFDPNDPVKYDFSLCHIGIDVKNISDFNVNSK